MKPLACLAVARCGAHTTRAHGSAAGRHGGNTGQRLRAERRVPSRQRTQRSPAGSNSSPAATAAQRWRGSIWQPRRWTRFIYSIGLNASKLSLSASWSLCFIHPIKYRPNSSGIIAAVG